MVKVYVEQGIRNITVKNNITSVDVMYREITGYARGLFITANR